MAGRLRPDVGRIGLGGAVHDPDDPFDDVVHVGEVPLHLAVVEDVDGPPFEDGLGRTGRGHVRPPPGTIDGEEAQAGGGQAVEMAVGMGHQFVGLLGGCVEADRMVDAVVLGEGASWVLPLNTLELDA